MKGKSVNSKLYLLIRTLVSLLAALIVGGVVFYMAGFNPLQAYKMIFKGAFGSANALLTTLNYAMPLLLTGLSFCLAQTGGLINMGAEGQLYIGGMAAALVAGYMPAMPAFIHIPVVVLVSCCAAGLLGALVGFLKVRFGTSEVILTLMFNYISMLFCTYLVAYPLKDVEQGIARTVKIAPSAQFPALFSGHFLSSAVVLSFVAVVLGWLLIKYTRYGFRVRTVGSNRLAAQTAGIRTGGITVSIMFLSAAVAGLCGATQIMGVQYRFINNFSTGFGFEGVAVAALAGYNPLVLLVSGVLWGGLKAGAVEVNRIASIPMDIIQIIQAIVVLFVAAPLLLDTVLKPLKKAMAPAEGK